MKSARLRAYFGLALVAAGLTGLALSGDLVAHQVRFVAFYGLAGLGFALLATAAAALPLGAAVVVAVVLRLIFLPGMPSLSDDYHRYVWDGRVQAAGINPYRYAPRDAHLDGVAYARRDLINHPQLRTVYPPLAEGLLFGIAAACIAASDGGSAAGGDSANPDGAPAAAGADSTSTGADSTFDGASSASVGGPGAEVFAFKLLFGAFDLATAGAVWWLAGSRRRRFATTLYLLCPAVILQTWEAAHLEAAAVFFCVLAAALLARRRDAWAGVALGLAAALKLTPAALLLPALLGGRAAPARLLAGFVPAFVIPYVPYLLSGGAFGSVFEGGTRWTGGALLFALLSLVFTSQIARWLALAAFVAGAVWIARRLRGRTNTAAAFAWTLTLLTLCLPVVHAWYWLTPLALGLAAGVWLPVVVGMVAPLPEALAPAWPDRFPPWRQIGQAARRGLQLSAAGALAILRR